MCQDQRMCGEEWREIPERYVGVTMAKDLEGNVVRLDLCQGRRKSPIRICRVKRGSKMEP